MNRTETHSSISEKLANLSDEKLSSWIENARPMHTGIGGKSVLLTINETSVFVKKVPITDLERLSENYMSTANLFNLPMVCQYRVGGPGFGVWREVAAHKMTTEWVLKGECGNFPLLYHSRILPTTQRGLMTSERLWENFPAVRERREALENASAYVALFLEYFPKNLLWWLGEQLHSGEEGAEAAARFIDRELKLTNAFMKERRLTHFDAHFENILTDGKQLYFTDFGLALSSQFELTKPEREFLDLHRNFDQCNSALSFVIALIISLYGRDQWETQLREYLKGSRGKQPPAIDAILRRDASLALTLKEFFRDLVEGKSPPYPTDLLENKIVECQEFDTD